MGLSYAVSHNINMEQGKRTLATLLAAATLTTTAASLQAVTFAEPGDAGQTLATAAAAGAFNGATGLTQITGSIAGANGLDADLYSFTLSAATSLRFTATSTAGIDTSLFLFSSAGVPLLANDDQSNTNFQAAFSTGSLAAGTYYLGVALSGNEAVNANAQLLFTGDQPTTNVRGPASGLNPAAFGAFNGQTFIPEGGAYSIGFAAVPEPSTCAAFALGAAALGLVLRRRQNQTA